MNKKVVLGVLILIGVVVTVPAARERAGALLAPIERMLSGPAARLKQPFQNWTAQNDGKHLLRGLADMERRGRRIPTGRAFDRYAQERLNPKRGGLDPWGNSWSLDVQSDSIVVWSAGPDSIPETEDDVRVSEVRQ